MPASPRLEAHRTVLQQVLPAYEGLGSLSLVYLSTSRIVCAEWGSMLFTN